jgi:uncharacterized phage protein (TIGR02218 family)
VKTDIPVALAAHYASGSTTLARLWKITRLDGVVYGFTDHDAALSFGGVNYRPTSAFDASAISTRAELNVDNLEVVGILDDAGITAEDIEAGRWDGASVRIVEVNWADLSMGENVLRIGEIGNVQRRRGQYVAELRGLMQKLQNNVGRVVSPSCDAALGDARCGVDLDGSPGYRVAGTITSVTSRRVFAASSLAQAAAYFSGGDVTFTSGLNDGIRMEVKTHGAIGALQLQLPMPFAVQVGDTFTIVPGCDHTKDTCKAKFNNVVNFRGFSFVPGPDKTLLVGGQ